MNGITGELSLKVSGQNDSVDGSSSVVPDTAAAGFGAQLMPSVSILNDLAVKRINGCYLPDHVSERV